MDEDINVLMRALDIDRSERGRVSSRLAMVGGLVGLWRAGPEALDPLGCKVVDRWSAVSDLWHRVHRPALHPVTVDGPEPLLECLDPFLPLAPVESFHAVFLDGRGRFAGTHEVARGSVNACLVHPREVFAPAIRARAAAVAAVHNHPSGDPEPSGADLALTERLTAAGHLVGIPLVDHLIVGRGAHRSLGPGLATEPMAIADPA